MAASIPQHWSRTRPSFHPRVIYLQPSWIDRASPSSSRCVDRTHPGPRHPLAALQGPPAPRHRRTENPDAIPKLTSSDSPNGPRRQSSNSSSSRTHSLPSRHTQASASPMHPGESSIAPRPLLSGECCAASSATGTSTHPPGPTATTPSSSATRKARANPRKALSQDLHWFFTTGSIATAASPTHHRQRHPQPN